MKVVSGLVKEFEEICSEYSAKDEEGKDIVALIRLFGDEFDHFDDETDTILMSMAWQKFLGEHSHQVTSVMVGMIIYLLRTYWPFGENLYHSLPPMEKIILRETVGEIEAEIARQSAENS